MDSSAVIKRMDNMESVIRHFDSPFGFEDERIQELKERVLSMEEILDVIFEFYPARASLSDCLKLRTVSKLWKKCAFKLLIDHCTTYRTLNPSHVARLRHFSRKVTCDSYIPICVKFGVYYEENLRDWAGLQDYTSNIAEFHLWGYLSDANTSAEHISSFQLPKLKKLLVLSGSDNLSFNQNDYCVRIIDQLIRTSKQLKEFHLTAEFGKYIPGNEAPWAVPRQVTHLVIDDTSKDIRIMKSLLSLEIDNLQSLVLSTCSLQSQIADSSILSKFVEKFATNLRNIDLTDTSTEYTGMLQLAVMEKLTTLTLKNIGVVFTAENMADILPKITKLEISGVSTACMQVTLDNMNHVTSNYDYLTELQLTCSGVMYSDVDMNPFSNMFKYMGNLKSLSLLSMTSTLATKVLVHIFTYLTGISKLVIEIDKKNRTRCPVDENNIDYLLTGYKKQNIPNDKSLWGGMIERQSQSILNLKGLEELELDTTAVRESVISPFLMATLQTLPKLKKLVVCGNQTIAHDLVSAWTDDGREIENSRLLNEWDYSSDDDNDNTESERYSGDSLSEDSWDSTKTYKTDSSDYEDPYYYMSD